MKKISVIFLIIGAAAITSYVLVRKQLSTPHFTASQPKDTASKTKPAETVLDLRPKLIAKLQELVKKGSDGLYNLHIHEVNPDVLKSTIGISNAELIPDTTAIEKLRSIGKLPNTVFRIKTDSIWIDGLGLKDILSKDVIDIKKIHILQPTIEIFSNKNNKKKDNQTVYQKIADQIKHLGIGEVKIEKGTLINHSQNKTTKFNDISIHLSNILVDSSTQFDQNRFLFAKEADITLKNYSVPTSNNLYTFNISSISISATKQLLVAKNISLQSHYNKSEFQQHIKTMKERYEISIPSVEIKGTDWWNLINNETLQADLAVIKKATINVYLDRRKPAGGSDPHGFPHQLLMRLPLKVKLQKLNVSDLDITYEEFSKLSGKTGKIFISNLHGTINNITNMPQAIRQNKTTTVAASGLFMNTAPIDLTIHFDLSNYKSGSFTADLKTKKRFDGSMVNPIAEPLGMFMVKKGELKELNSYVSGNNYKASGNVLFLYNDLHVTPLEKNKDGEINKKNFTSLLANAFVIKDDNPAKNGQVRKADASYTRGSGTFFNLIWKTTFVGILKTIGAPEKLANQ